MVVPQGEWRAWFKHLLQSKQIKLITIRSCLFFLKTPEWHSTALQTEPTFPSGLDTVPPPSLRLLLHPHCAALLTFSAGHAGLAPFLWFTESLPVDFALAVLPAWNVLPWDYFIFLLLFNYSCPHFPAITFRWPTYHSPTPHVVLPPTVFVHGSFLIYWL